MMTGTTTTPPPSSYPAPSSLVGLLGQAARRAADQLAYLPADRIYAALTGLAAALRREEQAILTENAQDVEAARRKNLPPPLLDRLTLTPARINAMAEGLEAIAAQPDPVGKVLASWARADGLRFERVSVPIGVLGLIYESRPNVAIDAAGLSLKSRNALILRGGSDSRASSQVLYRIMKDALAAAGLPPGCVGMVTDPDRNLVTDMLHADKWIDVLIPRGGKSLIELVRAEARMPVFSHLDGICHVYVDASADPAMAEQVLVNSKLRRTGICGAAETLLLDEALPDTVKLRLLRALLDRNCAVAGDSKTMELEPRITPATEADWSTEYLDAKISVKCVDGVEAAVEHINDYGSHHTDTIVASDQQAAEFFLTRVNSAIVLHNASTQFADGGEFGMGGEIGIATGKFHARGPVGPEQLTIYKYQVRGHGHIRA